MSDAAKLTTSEFEQLIASGLPWASALKMGVDSLKAGEASLRLPYNSSSIRPGGTISGPTMMALADACMYAVVLSELGPVALAVTTSLNINFLNKPRECDLIAKGRLLKMGKRLAVVDVEIYSEGSHNKLVAHSTGTYSIPPRAGDSKDG